MRKRLDQLIVEKRLAPTRSRAQDVIQRGLVAVDGVVVAKPGARFALDSRIEIQDGAGLELASRAGLKLDAALDAFDLDPENRTAADVGASTGGFTDVLLRRGAKHVYSIDVGSDQLHPLLRKDMRVTVLENQDARALTRAEVAHPIEAVVIDVSFISVLKVLPNVLTLTAPGAWLVALIKPQFEVGASGVGKGGIVRDAEVRAEAVQNIKSWLHDQPGWRVVGLSPSPIVGRSGNHEYLIGAISS